jgi:deoxyribodipyrimidine photolyase-related protein
MTILLLGDQCNRSVGPLARRDEPVLMIEAHGFARRMPYHPHKLTLVFAAMRHLRDELRADGRTVYYHQVERFGDGLSAHFEEHPDDELVMMRPPSHGAADRFRDLVAEAGGTIEVVDNELFLCSRTEFEQWAPPEADRYRHEDFYRFMRRKTGYLMDDGDPVGGEWNYDDENRQTPPEGYEFPDPPAFDHDDLTRETMAWVDEEFETWGAADPEQFPWPVTRRQAVQALRAFVDDRLAEFGPYQDAMVTGEWSLNHGLVSAAINVGLLHPAEVVEAVLEAHRERDLPLNSVEGFVRQVIGWREFMRHVYREAMPELATANQLGAAEDLPPLYTSGETDMRCLSESVDTVWERGYSHHIQRLMILSNFALIYGVEPEQLNEWFHYGYVDAYHWVTTPNVVEMGLYGDGVFATKPYAASANYVNKMSDYCSGCPYYHTKTTGEGACPFNALYWDFLDRNEDQLRSNHRMGLVYGHVDDKREAGDMGEIRERAETVREMAEKGEL